MTFISRIVFPRPSKGITTSDDLDYAYDSNCNFLNQINSLDKNLNPTFQSVPLYNLFSYIDKITYTTWNLTLNSTF